MICCTVLRLFYAAGWCVWQCRHAVQSHPGLYHTVVLWSSRCCCADRPCCKLRTAPAPLTCKGGVQPAALLFVTWKQPGPSCTATTAAVDTQRTYGNIIPGAATTEPHTYTNFATDGGVLIIAGSISISIQPSQTYCGINRQKNRPPSVVVHTTNLH